MSWWAAQAIFTRLVIRLAAGYLRLWQGSLLLGMWLWGHPVDHLYHFILLDPDEHPLVPALLKQNSADQIMVQ
jgi:hypothetical protein